MVCNLLGFDQGSYDAVRRLAAKWCAESSVHGGKKRSAKAVKRQKASDEPNINTDSNQVR